MIKLITKGLLASVYMACLASAATAGGPDPAVARLEGLLARLEALTSERGPGGTTVSREAALSVLAKITKQAGLALPIRCTVTVTHVNSSMGIFYTETASRPVLFTGNSGNCLVRIPFNWPFADASGKVNIAISVFSDDCICDEDDYYRSSSSNIPSIVLPGDGTVRFVRVPEVIL